MYLSLNPLVKAGQMTSVNELKLENVNIISADYG